MTKIKINKTLILSLNKKIQVLEAEKEDDMCSRLPLAKYHVERELDATKARLELAKRGIIGLESPL